MSRKTANAILALGSALLLSGCVVAAIPVVASGALLGREAIDPDESEDRDGVVAVEDTVPAEPVSETPVTVTRAPAPSPVAVTDEKVVEVQMAEVPVEELPVSQIGIPEEELAVVARPSSDFIGPVDVEQGEAPSGVTAPAEEAEFVEATPVEAAAVPLARAAVPVTIPELARPAVTPKPTLPTGPTDFRAYDALYSYVDSQARRDPVQSPRQSAILAAPGSLSPSRTDCSIRPPAVLIDLDPGDQTFDPSITPQTNPALGQILASLRLQAVDVFWISKQPAIAAGAIRKSLIASGLDPRGDDALLLMRRADDRKQARRKELAETHCLLAIGGDTRADFDELYLYLRDTSAAQPLEELIGAGWFLTPLPLTAQTP